jgi:hypothetical protein
MHLRRGAEDVAKDFQSLVQANGSRTVAHPLGKGLPLVAYDGEMGARSVAGMVPHELRTPSATKRGQHGCLVFESPCRLISFPTDRGRRVPK